MRELSGKTAFVTGGASGIGFALGAAFAQAGMKVMLADIETGALAEAVKRLHDFGHNVRGVACDVADPASVERAAKASYEAFGKVHVVCNNAGVAEAGGIDNISLDNWRWVLDVNLMGVLHGIRTFLPQIRAHGEGGHFVNTASMAGLVGMRWLGIYSASKFAVVGLSEALHRELAERDIGVTVLCPMIVRTNINENSVSRRPDALRNPDDPLVPPADAMSGGVIEPEEVARRVVRAIERRDLYVLTHPEQREILRRRWTRQDRMFEPDRW